MGLTFMKNCNMPGDLESQIQHLTKMLSQAISDVK